MDDRLDYWLNGFSGFQVSTIEKYHDVPISSLIELTVRSSNCLNAAEIYTLGELIHSRETELLRIPNFGRGSLNEIKGALRDLNLNIELNEEFGTTTIPPKIDLNPPKKAFDDFHYSNLEEYYDVPVSSLMSLSIRLTNCLNFANKIRLGDLIECSEDELMRIPNFGISTLKEIQENLYKINMSLKSDAAMAVSYVIDDSSLETYIDSLKSHIGDRSFEVLAERIGLYNEGKTLDEVGNKFGVTRERIRQIETKVKKHLIYVDLIKLIDKKLYSVRDNLILPLYVEHLPTHDPWFNILTKNPRILKKLINVESSSHNVDEIDGEEIIIFGTKDSLSDLIAHLKDHLDENIRENFSKKDLKDYIKLLKPDMANEITSFVIQKLDYYKFTEGSDDSQSFLVSSGSGVIPTVIALLESSDKPLKSIEIFQKLGYSLRLQRNCTNQMGESKNIFTFGRSLYGVKKHLELSDTDIDLINSQIKVHIQENGPNKQWHSEEILDNINFITVIKAKLDLYKLSTCIKLSDEFNYLGRFVFVLAGSQNTQVEKKDFSQMAMDVLLKSNKPLSFTEIKSIIKKDRSLSSRVQLHSRGRLISLKCFPKNKRKTKWALLDKHLNLSRDDIIEFVNEMLLLIKQHGNILTAENAIQAIKNNNVLNRFEDKILTLFDLCDNNINFIVKKDTLYHVDADITDLSQVDCLKKIAAKVKSKGIKKQDLLNQASQLYGKKVQHNLGSKLTKFGFIYDTHEAIWYKGELIGDW